MPNLLVRDGKLVARPDGRLALDCDPDCCAPVECFDFARMVPCGAESPDPACDIPPGKGVLYVCNSLGCSHPGVGVYHNGICWTFDAVVTRPEIPPGSMIIETGPVECIQCKFDPRCGMHQYAEAIPCNPALPRPWPLYCPAGLPYDCNTINLSSLFGVPEPHWVGQCFTFRRDAATNPYPQGTNVYIVPPGLPIRTCCTCQSGCVNTNVQVPRICANTGQPFSLQCCCGNVANASVLYSGSNEIDGYSVFNGQVFRNSHTTETWGGVSIANGFHRAVRQLFNPDGSPDGGPMTVFDDVIPPFGATCHLRGFPDFTMILCDHPCEGFGSYTPPNEQRTCTTWSISSSFDCSNSPNAPFMVPGARVTSQGSAVLVGMVPMPGCSSTNCDGSAPSVMPGGGTDNGGVRIRGGGSRQIDPAVAAMVQRQYGGCRGCGDSPPPV